MQHLPARVSRPTAAKPVAAALLAILVGIGLSRFAYSPLIPAIVEAGWFSPGPAAFLGAANLAGYLVGALAGRRLAAWTGSRMVLRLSMLLASIAFAASALPLSFAWLFVWRLMSGVTGGALMVLAAPSVLRFVPAHRRGLAAGVIFGGVGLGIVLSGTFVPRLLAFGLPETWLGLAAFCLGATAVAWHWWPAEQQGTAAYQLRQSPGGTELRSPALLAVFACYGLIAVGLVPHMVFLVDFVARGLEQGIAAGGQYWVLFGFGALLGPPAAGRLADHFGFGVALRAVLLVHVASVAILAVDHSAATLTVSSLLVGSAVSGTVPLVLGQVQEGVRSPEAQKTAWGIATATFALGQAGAGYLYSCLFALTGDFALLFILGSAALFCALFVSLLSAIVPPERPRLPRTDPAPDDLS